MAHKASKEGRAQVNDNLADTAWRKTLRQKTNENRIEFSGTA